MSNYCSKGHWENGGKLPRKQCRIDQLEAKLAECGAWSACEAAANIPAVGEYVAELEKQRDALAIQCQQLRDAADKSDALIACDDAARRGLAASNFAITCACGRGRKFAFTATSWDIFPCPYCEAAGTASRVS